MLIEAIELNHIMTERCANLIIMGNIIKTFVKLIIVLLLFRPSLADVIIITDPSESIQTGIDNAMHGDTVLVGPGLYEEQLVFSDKSIILTSRYFFSRDTSDIINTIIDGNNGAYVISIESTVDSTTSIIGFTIQNGDDGIFPAAKFNLLNSRIINCSDGVDYESGSGGLCKDNLFENNSDDGIDLDGSVEIVIDNNIIINNGDDGIEIRLHEYAGPLLNITIKNNFISGNDEDGIQLIDYPDVSDREYHILNNLIVNNAMAGIGCMSDGNTVENYEGASIIEPIFVIDNTIYGNEYGVTGGDNLIAKNNIIANCNETAMKNVDNNSIISFSNLWNNGLDFDNCNIDDSTLVFADPAFVAADSGDFHLTHLSASIDIGDTLSIKDPDSTRNDAGPFYYHQSLSDFSLISPSSDTLLKTTTPHFAWRASKPFGKDTVTYDLYYSLDSLATDSLIQIIYNIVDTSYTVMDTLRDFSRYQWKVLAKNPWSLQNWSSERWTFSINTDSASPVISDTLPVLNFNEDDSLSVLDSFWYPFIDDDATPDSLLRYQILGCNKVSVLSKEDTNIFKSELNWFGMDSLQLSVTDLGDSTSSSIFFVSVNPINDIPLIHDLPDSVSFFADSSIGINFWDYISDVETPDSLLFLSFRSIPDSIITDYQNSTGLLTISSSGFVGNADLVVTVTDDSLASDRDTIQVISHYRDILPPEIIEPLPLINFNEDDSLNVSNTNWYPYIYDEGTADSLLTISIYDGSRVSVSSLGDSYLFYAIPDWFGLDTLQFSTTDLKNFTSYAPLFVSVNPVNDLPGFTNLPSNVYFYSDSLTELNLWNYVSDIETPDSLLKFDLHASPDSIHFDFQDSTGLLTISSSGFIGMVELEVSVTDEFNGIISDTMKVYSIFRDINPPLISEPLPTIQFNEDDSLFVLNSFWYPYISDEDTHDSLLIYNISGGTNISIINYDDSSLLRAGVNWYGSDTLLLTVSEPGNLANSASFDVIVHPVNDPPEFHNLPDSVSFYADSTIAIDIWNYVSDVETPDSLLNWIFKASADSLIIDFQNSTGKVFLSSVGFIGKSDLFITVIDDSNGTAIDTINVISVYRDVVPPLIIEPLPLVNINEDDSVFVLNSFWYPYVYDEGTADSLLTFHISQGKNVTITDHDTSTLLKPSLNWYGSDTLQLSVTDSENLTSSSTFSVSVKSVNDPPVISSLPDSITIEHQSVYSLHIWDFVEDIETPDSSLIYNFQPYPDSLQINFIDSTGIIELTPIGNITIVMVYIQVSDDNNATANDSILIKINRVTSLETDYNALIPDEFVLNQNYPNPFNPVTTITFGVPEKSAVKLEIYDILGRKTLTLFNGKKPPGYHSISWNATNYSSGLYIYRLSARGKRNAEIIKKMILLK